MADAGRKRKQQSDTAPSAKRPRFPMRPQHHIATQPTKSAYPNGEVNVKTFLKSHEKEIKSLENAMRAAKKGLSRRAFQDVPRELRRRTASHNPQRVPKRLRVRAKQEAREDNTPISKGTSGSGISKGKKKYLRKDGIAKSREAWEKRAKSRKEKPQGDAMDVDGDTDKTSYTKTTKPSQSTKPRFSSLATPATPPSRFRRRQRDKTWLPTHVWHSKRARMTEPRDPLWRFALPLQPAVKSYRLTHRAATQRGAVAWDMSYISTISLEGPEASMVDLLKALNFGVAEPESPWQNRGRALKWRNGTRSWEGWIYAREPIPLRKIARVTIIWCVPEENSKKRKAFVRVHPSAFLQLWNEVVRVSKVQKPIVTVEDLRFEIGSVEIVGPAAAEALCSILRPVDSAESGFTTLASVADACSLPVGALLAFAIQDPRLYDPPQTSDLQHDEASQNALIEYLASWPVDSSQTVSPLFERSARLTAQRCMPSDKSINRRKSACTLGQDPESRATDPHIPVVVYTSRESKSWTILLPWKCVQPVWRGIMRYPVSTGGNPRFGGLKERRQVDFERSVPQFPFDYPATEAGRIWELRERKAREHEWTKRPKGKRIEWSTIDLGNGHKGEVGDPWACDWERLLPKPADEATKAGNEALLTTPYQQLSGTQACSLVEGKRPMTDEATLALFTVKLKMMQRGIPTDCARIYQLPKNNTALRDQWLLLMPKPGVKLSRSAGNTYTSDVPDHIKRRNLARNLLEPAPQHEDPPKAGEGGYPAIPGEEDLIGFVTTGNYNLAEGKPSAIANLALHRIMGGSSEGQGITKDDRVCIVRQAGSIIGRLAAWEVV